MGDRANIEVREGENSVYLYSHWTGSEMPEVLRRALHRGEERWRDSSYLARIIICEMVAGYEMELTGFGISSTEIGASKHLLVNVDKQTVAIDGYTPISFRDYVASLRAGSSNPSEKVPA
jgi:hypothetical protein